MVCVRKRFSLLGDTRQSHTLAKPHRLWKAEKCHVVVHSVPVVVRVENALLDDVLSLPLLLHHQVVFAHPDHQILAHTVGSGKNPLWVNKGPTTESLSVFVQENNLPRPATRLCLPTSNNPQSPGNVLGVRCCIAVLVLISPTTLALEVGQLLLGRGRHRSSHRLLDSIRVLKFEPNLVADVEVFARLVPRLALAAL